MGHDFLDEVFSILMTTTTSFLKKACLKPFFACKFINLINIICLLQILVALLSYVLVISEIKDNEYDENYAIVFSILYLIFSITSSFVASAPCKFHYRVHINAYLFTLILNNMIIFLLIEFSIYGCCLGSFLVFGPVVIGFSILVSTGILYVILIVISSSIYYPIYRNRKSRENDVENGIDDDTDDDTGDVISDDIDDTSDVTDYDSSDDTDYDSSDDDDVGGNVP